MVECDKIKEFFGKTIEPEVFAKMMRRYNLEVVKFHMEMTTKGECSGVNLFTIKDGVFWLNELTELIDPYLDTEDQ